MKEIFNDLFVEFPGLEPIKDDIWKAFQIMRECYESGGKILICGNGGSGSDAEHITGELMKSFAIRRPLPQSDRDRILDFFPEDGDFLANNLEGALPAISLVSQTSLISAFANDVSWDLAYAQQVYGYGKRGDVLIALSTSGNSANIVWAVKAARAFGLKTIGFAGRDGGMLGKLCDGAIIVPFEETYRIQEFHLPIYHALCSMVEVHFFG